MNIGRQTGAPWFALCLAPATRRSGWLLPFLVFATVGFCTPSAFVPLRAAANSSVASGPLVNGASEGPNLVVNPDFESIGSGGTPSGWTTFQRQSGSTFSTITDSNVARSGQRCVAIKQTTTTQGNFAAWLQTIPVTENTVYRYSFWVKTVDVRPLTPFSDAQAPIVSGMVGFLDAAQSSLALDGPRLRSSNVFMTHDWAKFELSVRTPPKTAFMKINLVLSSAAGTVYFDSVSLVTSSFARIQSPDWVADAIAYEAGPWEYAQYGNGNAFLGLKQKLPELQDLGVNLLYLLPIWENKGWYGVTDFYAIYRPYGTEADLKALVADAHSRGIRVILDLAGTIGVSAQSALVSAHRDWFVLNPDNSPYASWLPGPLLALDTNLPAVQDYYAAVARYYVERDGVDGYRCDAASASPYQMFGKIRTAVTGVKPDAILIAEDNMPIGHETAFDSSYDFTFRALLPAMVNNTVTAAQSVSYLESVRNAFPPGVPQFRMFECQGLDYTIASASPTTDCALAFATLLLTADGLPLVTNGQEFGNKEPQLGSWAPLFKRDANPDADRYRATYKSLAGLRTQFAALRRGDLRSLGTSDNRVAAFTRTLAGEETIITVINFSNSALQPRLDLTAGAGSMPGNFALQDLLDGTRFWVDDAKALGLKLAPFQARVLRFATVRLANLSVRASMISGQTLIVGFSVSGGTRSILARGIGPSLASFGIAGAMANPRLELYSGGTMVAQNDDWGNSPALSSVAATVGAFSLLPNGLDAALLQPVDGSRSVLLKGTGAGIALVELYDTGSGTSARLINVSARNQVGTGDNVLIFGFYIDGTGTENLLIRAIGPRLGDFGVAGALTDPRLDVFRAGGATPFLGNDNWSASLTSTFVSAGAFTLTPGSKDAALSTTLPAGAYTVQVSGVGGTTGEALVEIYELP